MELLDFHSEPLQWHKKDLFKCRIFKNHLWTIRMKSVAKLRPDFYTWGAGARGGRPVGPTSRVLIYFGNYITGPLWWISLLNWHKNDAVGFPLSLKRLVIKGSDIREERTNQILVDHMFHTWYRTWCGNPLKKTRRLKTLSVTFGSLEEFNCLSHPPH